MIFLAKKEILYSLDLRFAASTALVLLLMFLMEAAAVTSW
jgi:hypothetical protein